MSLFSFIVNLFKKDKVSLVQPKLRQSLVYDNLKIFIAIEKKLKVVKTQATEFEKKQYIPVVLADQKAYWILDNTLFEADEVDGSIDKDTARAVDTMAMDKVQLDKTIFIVDALTKGAENDNWNSRD